MLSTAKSANAGFRPVQLFAPPWKLATHLAEKIPFNNPKKYVGVNNVNNVRTHIRV